MTEPTPSIPLATLADWIEGRLDPDAAAAVTSAVESGDQRLIDAVAWLHRFMSSARAIPLDDAPRFVRQTLTQHFDRWARANALLQGAEEAFEAMLLFDSRQDLAGVGTRGTKELPGAVHLAYTTPVGDLLVDVWDLGRGRVRLDGQVLTTSPDAARIFEAVVEGAGFSARTVDGDELGRFAFADLPVGVTRLTARNGELSITAAMQLAETSS